MGDIFERSGPHIGSGDTISRSMWDVVIALLPAFVVGVAFFGWFSAYLVIATALAAVVIEIPFHRTAFSWKSPFGDGSAFLAGFILGLTLSPASPWWFPFAGAGIAIVIGKHAFGGIGQNIFNPALVARAILLIGWPALITEWHEPFSAWAAGGVSAVTTATPLFSGDFGYLELLLGNVPGSIGETSAIALLLGAVYLHVRGFRFYRQSLGFLLGAAATALLIGVDPIYAILAGSVVFGALYMATDYVSSPMARTAGWVFGIGAGALTIFIREFSIYPAGLTFAILIMNATSYLLDMIAGDAKFGEVARRTFRRASVVSFASAAVIFVVAGVVVTNATSNLGERRVSAAMDRHIGRLFPENQSIEPLPELSNGLRGVRVYDSESGELGYVVVATGNGYNGEIDSVIGLSPDFQVSDMYIDSHTESGTLGSRITEASFLRQFLGLTPETRDSATDDLARITGATTSSRAVARTVHEALQAFAEPEADDAPAEYEVGIYTGTGAGYQGDITVEVVVENERIRDIRVTEHEETRQLLDRALETVVGQIIETQSPNVDAHSGATGSSQGIMRAVRDALDL